jgi:hypothetical protein
MNECGGVNEGPRGYWFSGTIDWCSVHALLTEHRWLQCHCILKQPVM